MSDETNEFRDVHYTKSRYENQIKQFEIDASKENFENWKIYEAWLIGHNRKLSTILKQLGAFKRILQFYPSDNMKDISTTEMIELNAKIVTSNHMTQTKIVTQLFIRGFLKSFVKTEDEKKEIHDIIKILPEPNYEGDPDSDECGKTISYEEFKKIYRCMPNAEMKMMVQVLFATGMRITELYNIIPGKIKFIPKKKGGLTLPPSIFGYQGAWIYTRGKRTASKRDGRYLYFMSFYTKDLKKYIERFASDVYIFNFSYSYFLQVLHKTVKKENLPYVVHPHLFRHTFATKLFKTCSDQTVKKIMNWAKNSNMPQKYSHLKKADIVDVFEKIQVDS